MRAGWLFAVVLLLECSPPPESCDGSSCHGCCDALGICQPGFDDHICGINGSACNVCPPDLNCVAGTCVRFDSNGGGHNGFGGGNAQGGGSGGGSAWGGGVGGGGSRHIDDAGYPAPHPDFPHELFLGGPIISTPRFVSVTFSNDDPALVQSLDDFVATLGQTDYWRQTTSEYGVDAGVAAPPLHSPDVAPSTLYDGDIEAWLNAQLNARNPALGPPDPSTVYVMWYPASTSVIVSGTASCFGFLAYHYAFAYDGGTDGGPVLAYAVVPRCSGALPDAGDLDVATSSAAHEMIESVTDPNPFVPAWGAADEGHVVFNMMLYGETADLCEFDTDSYYTPIGYPYLVQRSWSNLGAARGYPCVPVATPFFNAMPLLDDPVAYDWAGTHGTTQGIHVAMGQTKALEIELFSSAPTDPITITAYGYPDPSTLGFTIPQSSGVNGDVLQVQVQHLADDPTYGGAPFMITSTLGDRTHYYFGFVGD
jgi:hypothetical protein